MVPHWTHPSPLSGLTGAKGRFFRTCRKLVKRRWVWNQEKGNVEKHLATCPSVPTRCDIPVMQLERWNQLSGSHQQKKQQILPEMDLSIFNSLGLQDMLLSRLM